MAADVIGPCLTDGQLQRLVEGLAIDEEGALLAHIERCAMCRKLVAGAARLADDPPASPALAATSPTATEELPLVRGVVVGRYVVLDAIGGGAMGEVYAAYDPELDRKVALKLLRDAGGAERQRRLVREAQTLAKLSHPNVVPVHDVGTHGDRTFIAMELVPGRTVREWLPATRPSWRQVVAVFLRAGSGLAAAHAAKIVHRDFKPDNVLVGDDGGVRVVDFGLAGWERPGSGGGDVPADALTRSGTLLGTPVYMAPELLAGDAATPASDQFAFAASLYEGLYGERPFSGSSLDDLRAATSAGAIRSAPHGTHVPLWLRRIALRGLAARPDDRFPSMAAMLAALGRDPGRRWRTLGLVTVGVALAAGGLVAVRSSKLQLCEAGPAEIASAWDAARKAAVRTALLAEPAPAAPSAWAAVERALDAHAAEWVASYTDACRATQVRGDQSQELLDRRMDCLRRDRDELRALTDVLATPTPGQFEHAAPAAWALPPVARCAAPVLLRARVAREVPAPFARDVAAVRALLRAGQLRLALASAEGLSARAGDDPATQAAGMAVLGDAETETRRLDLASASFERAFRAASAAGDERTAARALIGSSWVVGVLQSRRPEGAEPLRLARYYAERLADDEIGGDVAYHEGIYRHEAGDLVGAEERFARARELRERALGPKHPLVAKAELALARTRRERGRLVEAIADTRRGIAILEEALGPEHPTLDVHLEQLATEEREDFGNYDAAIRLYERARDHARARGPGSPEEGYIDASLGAVLADAGRYADGIARAEEGLKLLEAAVGPDHQKTGYAHWTLSGLYGTQGRYDEALAHADAALAILERSHGSPLYVAAALPSRALARAALGAPDATADAERALAISAAAFRPGHPGLASVELQLCEALLLAHRPDAALGRCLSGLLDATLAFGAAHPMVAYGRRLSGEAWLARGDVAKARGLLEPAVAYYAGRSGDVLDAARARFAFARAAGDTPEARALARAARDGFRAVGSRDRRELDAVERWLAR
jgi:tetratricopeptide (TPR) repeat protein